MKQMKTRGISIHSGSAAHSMKTTKTPLGGKIDKAIGHRWIEGSTADTFHRAGYRMLLEGVGEDSVIEILKALYDAAANEFGVRGRRK